MDEDVRREKDEKWEKLRSGDRREAREGEIGV